MARYIIGDIHGHYETLIRLVEEINFDRTHDTLYFVGDLINGGTQNVEVIEFLIELGDSAKAILGNHDLSTIASYYGARRRSSKATVKDLVNHPRSDDLFDWLRHCRLTQIIDENLVVVHAGVPSEWGIRETVKWSKRVEKQLQKDDPGPFLKRMFEPAPSTWRHCESKEEKLVYSVNALTRMRVVTRSGGLEFSFKSVLADLPSKLEPWFRRRARIYSSKKKEGIDPIRHIYFGHWSALGLHHEGNVTCLDSGVRWGGPLTALRLEDNEIFQVQPRKEEE